MCARWQPVARRFRPYWGPSLYPPDTTVPTTQGTAGALGRTRHLRQPHREWARAGAVCLQLRNQRVSLCGRKGTPGRGPDGGEKSQPWAGRQRVTPQVAPQ